MTNNDASLTPGGQITIGAIDTTNCAPTVNYVPLTSETYWKFTLKRGVTFTIYSR